MLSRFLELGPRGQGLVIKGAGWGGIFLPSLDVSFSSAQGSRLPAVEVVHV